MPNNQNNQETQETQDTQYFPVTSPTLQRFEDDTYPAIINPFATVAMNDRLGMRDTLPSSQFNLLNQDLTPTNQTPVAPVAPVQPQQFSPLPDLKQQPLQPQPLQQMTTTRKKVVPTAVELEARKEQQNIFKQQQKLIQDSTELARQEFKEQQLQNEAQAIATSDYETKLTELQDMAKSQIDSYKSQMDTQFSELQKMDIKDFWADKDAGRKVVGAISIALGALGSAFTGGKNVAYEMINNAINQDYRKQQAQIDLKRRALEQTGRLSTQVQNNFKLAESFLANKKAASFAKAEALLRTNLAKLGPEKITNEQNKLLNQLKLSQNNERLKAEQSLRDVVTQTIKPVADEAAKLTDKRRIDIGFRYRNDPVTLTTNALRGSYLKIKDAASRMGGAADMNLIFSYMKMLDPRSVVREGEYLTARKTQSIPDEVWESYQRLTTGGSLGKKAKAKFVKEAEGAWKSQLESQKAIDTQFRNIANAEGINLDSYFIKEPTAKEIATPTPFKTKDGKFIKKYKQLDKATGKKKTFIWTPVGYKEL
jgi:hypothetical protein